MEKIVRDMSYCFGGMSDMMWIDEAKQSHYAGDARKLPAPQHGVSKRRKSRKAQKLARRSNR